MRNIVDTPYEGGVFRCILKLDSDFPRSPPKGYFLTKIFHPNVSDKGDICVNTLKKDWNPAKWSLSNILGVIRCLLIIPFPESSLNEEAGKMFMDDYQEYARMAKLITKIHAKPLKSKKEKVESIENNNSFSNDSNENKETDEEIKEDKLTSKYANLDVSMEEEEKEPLQNSSHNYSNQLNERKNFLRFSNTKGDSMEEQNQDVSLKSSDTKITIPTKGVLSGSSLFGGMPNPAAKNKKKKMRRI